MNDYPDSVEIIGKRVKGGDTSSYKDLRVIYMERSIGDFLPWCKLMADKYSYPPAYYDVYYVLLTSKGYDIYSVDSLDAQTKEIAIEYLTKAAQKNYEGAVDLLDSIKNGNGSR